MGWSFIGEEPVSFDEQVFDIPMVGDELIRIEHVFNGGTFPGKAYALISNIYEAGERGAYKRSYPVKESARVYEFDVPQGFEDSDYVVHQLAVKRNRFARVDADANWRLRAWVWVPEQSPEAQVDGNPSEDGGSDTIFDGNP